jgi:hypothetical protein
MLVVQRREPKYNRKLTSEKKIFTQEEVDLGVDTVGLFT